NLGKRGAGRSFRSGALTAPPPQTNPVARGIMLTDDELGLVMQKTATLRPDTGWTFGAGRKGHLCCTSRPTTASAGLGPARPAPGRGPRGSWGGGRGLGGA